MCEYITWPNSLRYHCGRNVPIVFLFHESHSQDVENTAVQQYKYVVTKLLVYKNQNLVTEKHGNERLNSYTPWDRLVDSRIQKFARLPNCKCCTSCVHKIHTLCQFLHTSKYTINITNFTINVNRSLYMSLCNSTLIASQDYIMVQPRLVRAQFQLSVRNLQTYFP